MGRLPYFRQEGGEDTKINSTEVTPMKPPLLFFLGELSGETKHALFDPTQRTFNAVEFPELECQVECLSSGYGWLLLISRETSSVFFFNPLTRQRFQIPYRNSVFNAAAFSAPPTSRNCTVFAVETPTFTGQLHIDTFLVGQGKTWIRHTYNWGGPKEFNNVVEAVCCNGVLYCMDSRGRVATFENGHWNVVSCRKGFGNVCKPYLVELNGQIFAGKKGAYGVLDKLYKLKFENGVVNWEELKETGSVTLFLGPHGSSALSSSDVEGIEKKLFIAGENPESKCMIYDFDGSEYKKDTIFDAAPYSWWYAPVWVERPSLSST